MSARRPGPVARLLAGLVTGYQRWVSAWIGPRCRFVPSCSEYTREALLVRGPVVGLGLGVWRLLRCQPFSAGGYDPVPPRRRHRGAAAWIDPVPPPAVPSSVPPDPSAPADAMPRKGVHAC